MEKKLNILWTKPVLSKEIKNYDDSIMLEFTQHKLPISNKDVGKVDPKITRIYKFLVNPFEKGELKEIPLNSDTEFDLQKLQNFETFEYDNIVAGSYGRKYGEYLKDLTSDLKRSGYLEISAPIVIRFINFGETRRPGEESYYLFSRGREISLALHYGIPVKVWVVNLIPSMKSVRDNAMKYGYLKGGEQSLKAFVKNVTGKENLDELTARERFKVIRRMVDDRRKKEQERKFREEYARKEKEARSKEPLIRKSIIRDAREDSE